MIIERPPKSLLVVRDYFPPQVGGISEMMAHVCLGLGAASVSCVTAEPHAVAPLDDGKAARVHRLPSLFAQGSWRTFLALAVVWPWLLALERPAALQFATCQEAYWGLILQRLLRIPFAVYAHGTEVLQAVSGAWPRPRQALVAATRVFACSRYTAEILVDTVGVSPERIRVLNPGCDTVRFSPEVSPDAAARIVGDAERRPILLSVGNLVERKGHDAVLRTLPRLATRWPALLYVIVGDGPFRPQLTALARELGVEHLVRFVGHADLTTLPAFYRLCDVFVMPSRFLRERNDVEGFGIVYLEAGASGKPVVGGRSGGSADAVVDGETGLLVDPASHETLAAAIARVLENPAFAAQLGRNARKRIVEHFTWSVFAEKLRHEMTAMVLDR